MDDLEEILAIARAAGRPAQREEGAAVGEAIIGVAGQNDLLDNIALGVAPPARRQYEQRSWALLGKPGCASQTSVR